MATEVVAEAQVTWPVRSCGRVVGEGAGGRELLGLPLAMLGLAGVTAIDCRIAGSDRQHASSRSTPPSVALIVDVPGATPVARPAAVIVATEVVAEAQVTWLVRSCVELSEKVPVAVNCSVFPLAMLGLAGVTAIDTQGRGGRPSAPSSR